MANAPEPATTGYVVEGIEVVELSEVDLDFAMMKEAFRLAPPPTLESTATAPAKAEELNRLELFREVGSKELDAIAPLCQSIHAIPGHVLLAPGRLNRTILFVLDGQLRLYAPTGDKRPIAIVDIGHSTGLRSALLAQPLTHSVIATEVSHVVAVDLATIDEATKRSHALARNYAALAASYLRGDNCLHVGAQGAGEPARAGYVDSLTLLHNQYWLDTVLPRLIARYRFGDKPLAVAAFGIDGLADIVKQHGTGGGLRALQALGHWVLDQTRPTDLLAINRNRNFFAFLPDCDLEAARQLASRLQKQVQTLRVALSANKDAAPISVTLSLAAAQFEKGMKDNDFVTRAEMLINKSIKLGGNQVSEAL